MKERKQKTLGKRLLVAMLSVMMTVTFIPTSLFAYAAEPEEATDDVQSTVQNEVVQEEPTEAVQEEEPQTETTEAVKEEATKATEAQKKQEAKEDESEEAATTHFSKELDEIIVDVETEEGAFDEDVSLEVKPIAEDSKDYEEAEKALEKNKQVYAGMLAFDIHFENSKGKEIEPDGIVSVKMTAKKEALKDIAPDAFNADTVQITHIGKKATEVVADTDKKSDVDGTVDVAVTKKAVTKIDAEFEVEDFSTFALTWDSGAATIHWGTMKDGAFDEFEAASLDTDAASVSLDTTFANYDYGTAYYCQEETVNPVGSPDMDSVLVKKSDTTWEYTSTGSDDEGHPVVNKGTIADGTHIYVVYTPHGQDKPSGASNPNVSGPQTKKAVKDNGDGTYDIQLDIIGAVKKEETHVGANVLVVLDTTSSMKNSMTGATNRFEAARSAVLTLIDTLQCDKHDIDLALVEFDNKAGTETVYGWTDDYEDVRSYVADDAACANSATGTNWEIGLREAVDVLSHKDADPTYVIFVTDGEPNRYIADQGGWGYSAGDERNGNADTSRSQAQDEANAIVSGGNNFYGVFCGNATGSNQLSTLVDNAEGKKTIVATSQSAIQSEFEAIAKDIVNSFGSTDVSTNDGVTALSHVSATVAGAPGAFRYYTAYEVTHDSETGKYTYVNDAGEKVEVSESDVETYTGTDGTDLYYYYNRTTWDGAPGASYSEANGVTWDLSEEGLLKEGRIYSVAFTVWPSQDAYDLLANLNNRTQDYDSLPQSVKDQVYESGGVYYLKTNTKLTTAYTYNGTSYQDNVPFVQGAMDLESTEMDVRKSFAHSINSQDPFTSIVFYLLEDGKYYMDDGTTYGELENTETGAKAVKLPVNNSNGWKNSIYIAPGVMKVSGNQVEVLESGHKYSLEEEVLVGSEYEYEFTPQTVRPMEINGTLTYLVLVDKYNGPGKNGVAADVKTYQIDGETYYVASINNGELVGTNRKTAELDITKVVETNEILTDEQEAEETFTYRVTLQIPDGTDPAGIVGYEYVYRPNQDNAFYLYGYHEYEGGSPAATAFEDDIARLGDNKYRSWNTLVYRDLVEWENVDGKIVSKRDADGNIIWKVPAEGGYHTITYDMTLKQNEVIRFTNLPSGTKYTIQEIYANKYPADNVGGQTSGRTPVSDPSNIADEGYGIKVKKTSGDVTQTAVANDTVSGEIKDLDIRYYNQFTNTMTKTVDVNLEGVKALEGYNWSGESYHFTLTGGENAPMPAEATGKTEFDLTADSGSASEKDSFGRLRFTQEGTYTYTVTEDNAGTNQTINGKRILFDTAKTITIKVAADDSGNLSVESVTGDGVAWNANTSTASVTLTNKYNETSVDVTKVWDDANNQDNLRPDSVTITLLKNVDGVISEVGTVTLSVANNWADSWDNLNIYENGVEIVYTIVEAAVPAGYTATYSGTGNDTNGYSLSGSSSEGYTGTVTNTHMPEKTTVKVNKVWVDDNDRDKVRPASVTVVLKANGETVDQEGITATQTLSEDNEWKYEWTGLNKNKNGEAIEYTVEENAVAEYTTKITGTQAAGYTVTNTHEPKKTTVTVTKKWTDDSDRDGLRPESIDMQLKADGTAKGEPVTLDEDNDWTYTWNNLPVNEAGEAIEYTVDETALPEGYSKTVGEVTGDADKGFKVEIENKHEPKKTTVTVTKKWTDADDQDGLRPDSIDMQLKADGTAKGEPVTLDEDNDWTYTWNNLPVNEAGEAIEYTVDETAVPEGYSKTVGEVTGDADKGFKVEIENKHEPETTSITVKKKWTDNENKDGLRPNSIKVQFKADGELVEEVDLNEGNEWKKTWSELPVYKEGQVGQKIVYTVDEPTVPEYYDKTVGELTPVKVDGKVVGYEVEIENTLKEVVPAAEGAVLNIHKVDQDGKNLEGVKFTLANGNKTLPTVETDENGNATIKIPVNADWLPADERAPNKDEYEFTLVEEEKEGFEPAGPWTVTVETKKKAGTDETEVTYTVKEVTDESGEKKNIIERFISWITGSVDGESVDFVNGVATITNKAAAQDVTVTKTYEGIDALPATFGIEVEYVDYNAKKGDEPTKILLKPGMDLPENITEQAVDGKYTWTISNVRYGTQFSAKETGYAAPGYAVNASLTSKAGTETHTDTATGEDLGHVIGKVPAAKDSPAATFDFKNTYTHVNVEIDKEIDKLVSFDEDEEVKNITFTFRVVGKNAKNETKLNTVVAVEFNAQTGKTTQSAKIEKIPADITQVTVTEIDSGNYQSAEIELDEPITEADFTKTFKFAFKNTQNNDDYDSGAINKYEKSATGYVKAGSSQPAAEGGAGDGGQE